MALTDTIKQMQQMGYKEGDIINSLQARGISPKEINDSMAQLKVKDAVTDNNMSMQQDVGYSNYGNSQQGMEPSMMVMNDSNQEMQAMYSPQQSQMINPQTGIMESQMIDPQTGMPITNQYDQYPVQYPQGEAPYPDQESYGGYGQEPGTEEYAPEPGAEEYAEESMEGYDQYPQENYGLSTETITEIANQLIEEKLSKTNSEIKNITEVKELLKSKVDKIDDRLHKLESIIDQLQSSLIRKSFEQTQNLQDIKSEMHGMQSSFSKVLNPLVDNIREMETIKQKHHSTQHNSNTQKSTSGKKHKKKR